MEKNQNKSPKEICFEIIENKNNYELLKKYLIDALQNIINKDYYTVVNITGRIKDKESLFKKVRKKEYKSANEVMDYLGLRIVVNDVYKIYSLCEFIKGNEKLNFNGKEIVYKIDYQNSPNKTEMLGVDIVGYRGVHFILQFNCENLKQATNNEIEFINKSGQDNEIKVELQIKTELEDFWATNTHDKIYKSSKVYNRDMERTFNLLSGLLESVDYEFSNIEKEYNNKYSYVKKMITHYKDNGEVLSFYKNSDLDVLDESSLYIFLTLFFGDKAEFEEKTERKCIRLLNIYGITTISQFLRWIKNVDARNCSCKLSDLSEYCSLEKRTYNGILRNLLIIFDLEHFCKVVNENPEFSNEKIFSKRGSLQFYQHYNITEKMLKDKGFVEE